MNSVLSALDDTPSTGFRGPGGQGSSEEFKKMDTPAQAKQSRHGDTKGPRQLSENPSSASSVVDPCEAPEARVSVSSKKLSEKPMGGSHDSSFQSRSEAEPVGSANGGTVSPRLLDDSQNVHVKSSKY